MPINDKTINEALRSLIFVVIVEKIATRLIAKFAFLGMSFINPIFMLVLNKLAGLFYDELTVWVTFTVIDANISAKVNEYNKAVNALKTEIEKAETHVDTEELKKAREEVARKREIAKQAARDLIIFKRPSS